MNVEVRKLWAEKTFELMNIGAGALIFGQAFSTHSFSLEVAFLGIFLVVLGYTHSYFLLKR